MASKLLPLRNLGRFLKFRPNSSSYRQSLNVLQYTRYVGVSDDTQRPCYSAASRSFCSRPLNLEGGSQGPTTIDYGSMLQESDFHSLADSTIHDLQEKFEEYGDNVQVDGFDIDYGNEVLTMRFGDMGTYVLNKQTPNRQIWLSSPVSGPSRFDWDPNVQAWVYRRTKANLLKVLESEVEQLCGKAITLS